MDFFFGPADPPRALEMLAQRRQAELWESTLGFLERGKAEDALGNYAAAAILISEGLSGLEALGEASKRDDVLASYQEIVAQYTVRLQELRQLAATTPIPLGLPIAMDSMHIGAAAPAPVAPAASSSTAAPSPPDVAAEPLAQGKMCLELAMSADEAGYHDEATVALYTAAAEHYFGALKLETDEAADAAPAIQASAPRRAPAAVAARLATRFVGP